MLPNELRVYLGRHPQILKNLFNKWNDELVVGLDTSLSSMANVNCLIATKDLKYVMKFVSSMRRGPEELQVEIAVVAHLASKDVPVVGPLVAKDGSRVVLEKDLDPEQLVLLFPYVEGDNVAFPSSEQIGSMGRVLAIIQRDLSGFSLETFNRRFHYKDKWDEVVGRLAELKEWIWPFHEVISEDEFWRFWQLRRQELGKVSQVFGDLLKLETLTHGDFHHDNLRFRGVEVSSVLDFDNLIFAPRVMDLAIALHYLIYRSPLENPEVAAFLKGLFEGYESVGKLEVGEKQLLKALAELWLWSEVPWLHFYSGDEQRMEHEARFRRVLNGIRALEHLR